MAAGRGTTMSAMTYVDSTAAPFRAEVVRDEEEVANRLAERIEEDLRRQLEAQMAQQDPHQFQNQSAIPTQQSLTSIEKVSSPMTMSTRVNQS